MAELRNEVVDGDVRARSGERSRDGLAGVGSGHERLLALERLAWRHALGPPGPRSEAPGSRAATRSSHDNRGPVRRWWRDEQHYGPRVPSVKGTPAWHGFPAARLVDRPHGGGVEGSGAVACRAILEAFL